MSDAGVEISVRRLETRDQRTHFRSGNIELDRFFQRFAAQNQFRHHIGTTYVAVHASAIVGFATVVSGEIVADSMPKRLRRRLPAYPLPILRIARLAVDARFQGQGIGKLLLRAMLRLALDMRNLVGCVGVVVDAKADAADFYTRLGFQPLQTVSGELGDRPTPRPMFLSIKEIAAAAKSAH